MTGTTRSIMVWGTTLSLFLLLSYGICILYGLAAPAGFEMHKAWASFLPGFEWLTASGVLIGALWILFYAWYAATLLVLLRNWSAKVFGAPSER